MILLIGSEKGGVGKSTLACNMAAFLALKGRDVLLVDTDTQTNSSYWATRRDESGTEPRVACVQKTGKGIARQIADLADRYEEIVIDAGGRDSIELRYSMGVADKTLIPLRPGQFDIWTLEAADQLVEQMKAANPELIAKFLISCASPNMVIREAEETKEFIRSQEFENIDLADTIIRERISFRKAIPMGLSVVELAPDPRTNKRDEKAIAELTSLYEEIYER